MHNYPVPYKTGFFFITFCSNCKVLQPLDSEQDYDSHLYFYRLLQTVGAPMSLRQFPSGACVLQLNSQQDEEIAKITNELVSRLLETIVNIPTVPLIRDFKLSSLVSTRQYWARNMLKVSADLLLSDIVYA